MDLRNDALLATCRRSPVLRFDGVDGGGGFAASVKDLIVTLITYVASTVLSLELINSPELVTAVFAPGPRLAALFFGFAFVAVVLVGRVVGLTFGAAVSDSGSSSSLSATTVAGVHVVVDDTAALTASTFVCNEAM